MLGIDALDQLKKLREPVAVMVKASDQLEARMDLLSEQITHLEDRAADYQLEADTTLQARALLETYSEEEQESLRRRVEGLVSRGLQVIFGEDYGFRVEVGQSRGQAAMEFKIVTPSGERDPMDSHGGGVVNVVAFVLRVVVAALTPGLKRVLVLDEPFAQLSTEYLEPMGTFLRELVDASGIQLLIVSHEEEVAAVADKAYRLTKRRGVTEVSDVSG